MPGAGLGKDGQMELVMENNRLRVVVELLGAEIASIWDKSTGQELLWQGDPALWPHRAPLLFPVCGPLLDDRFEAEGQQYRMPPGGFALRMNHKLVCCDHNLICMRLESTPETEAIYPCKFAVKTTYALKENRVSSRMKVLNYDKKEMYFRCGFTTAFNCPEGAGDCRVRLEQPEALTILERDSSGFLTRGSRMWEPEGGVIPLSAQELDNGVIFKEPSSQYFQLECGEKGRTIRLHLREAPYAYLRAAPAGGPRRFLAMGSWHGVPDFADSPADWSQKESVIALGGMEEYYTHQTIIIDP